MATGIGDRNGRQKILEGLWLIGIEPTQLGVDVNLDGNAFLDALHRNGVNDDFIRRAIAGVDWRAPKDNQPLDQKIAELLRISGYRPDEIQAFADQARYVMGDPTGDPTKGLMRILTTQFNDRTAGAMIYKATGGKDITGAVWNPFRTDVPPKGADTRFGGGGILATNLPPGMTSVEPTNKYAQPGGINRTVPTSATAGVPTPPASVRATPAPARGAPTVSGQTPGAGGPGGGGPASNVPGLGAGFKPLTPAELRAQIEARYGWAAAFEDNPEVKKILDDYANGLISEDELVRRYRNTDFYKSSSEEERNWKIKLKTDPGDAALQLEDNVTRITNLARATGAEIDPDRVRQIAEMDLRFNWSDQMVNAAIASELRYDPSGAKTGVLAQLKQAQRDSFVPLSDQAMTAWAQSIVGGTKTQEQFTAYLRDQAKSLFPALSGALDNDPTLTVRHYLDPYGQTAAKTLGINADDIDWTDAKWNRFINQVDPKTGQRTVMNLADTQRTLMADDQYGFDQTTNGKAQKSGLARTILQQWGFMAAPSGSGGF